MIKMLITNKRMRNVFIALLSMGGVFAQDANTVSNQELEQFAGALMKIQEVTRETQEEMIAAVEKKGLEVQRFNEMMQANQDPDKEVEGSEDEIKKFESATSELDSIQIASQRDMEAGIVEEGLTVERYRAIAALVQNDASLQQKLTEYMKE